ncbi:beta-1,3-galactosyltransferase 5-like [Drosophila pseudoobscura]|uniref:Hexosyltransferase n=1 Tax=Drosophila pseudoobscura pseudoobscura TaxID=46245 RepID=A0A6I8VW06_DROPS|nr:beta-1,3-galactosyltransferase 5-like [Drosophila pseudoobscura]
MQNQSTTYPSTSKKKIPTNITVPIASTTARSSVPELSAQPAPIFNVYEPGHVNENIDNQKICKDGGAFLKLLILITSAQAHFMARMSIRHTWMHYGSRRDVGMAFVLGSSTNETLNEALNQENYIYGDMIRGHFIDSYFNLTLKTISMLEWVDTHCPRVKYILKTDDDMFINVPKLLAFIDGKKNSRTIYGRLAKKWKPIRSNNSKNFVSDKQYGYSVYPPFTTGPAYLLTGDTVHDLYVHSLRTYYFHLEDVFMTGFVASRLKIKRVHSGYFRNRRISLHPCSIRHTISAHMIRESEQYDLWRKLMASTVRCKATALYQNFKTFTTRI